MGKGRIIEEIADGRYKVELDKGKDERDVQLSQINDLLQGEEQALLSADAAVVDAQNEAAAETDRLNRLINELNRPLDSEEGSDLLSISDRINAAVLQAERASIAVSRAERRRAKLVMQLAGLRAKRDELEGLEVVATVEAWCADGESEMSGEVGTVEVPGEPIGPVLIKPGFEGAAEFDPVADGRLIQRTLLGGAQAYLNAALLPGWQKWLPTYRFGTITALDGATGTCAIELEPSQSSAQSLDVTPAGVLTGVPIEYRECNAAAFEEGDSVLIEYRYRSPEQPVVVGFKENPRSCTPYICITYIAYPDVLESYLNYVIFDATKGEVLAAHQEQFDVQLYAEMGPMVLLGDEYLFAADYLPGAAETGLSLLTLKEKGEEGYVIRHNGIPVGISPETLVSDGNSLYAINETLEYIYVIDAGMSVSNRIDVPAPQDTFTLSSIYKSYIACGGFNSASNAPFVALYDVTTGMQIKYVEFMPGGYFGGRDIALSGQGIAACDFNGELNLFHPVDWQDPGGEWIQKSLGNITYYPEGMIMTEDFILINQDVPTGYLLNKYTFSTEAWEAYGDVKPSGLSSRRRGYMTTHKKLYL